MCKLDTVCGKLLNALQKVDNEDDWHGTKLSLTIQGAWASHRAFVLRYLRQIAVITPYAQISFQYSSVDGRNDISMMFKRRTTIMPDPPIQVLESKHDLHLFCFVYWLKYISCF